MLDPQDLDKLDEVTKEYVDSVKEAYPGINEQDLYELVYEVARRRVEEAQR